MSATAFVEVHTATVQHRCQCGGAIGRGDHYKRTAIPPWGYVTPEGETFSVGYWSVFKLCHDCRGSVS